MIHEVGVEIRAKLAARGCPFPVVDGPERTKLPGWASERIVLEHDDNGDTFGPARSQSANGKRVATRLTGAKITIFAQETRNGAQAFEHRRRAEQVLDMVIVALRESITARKNGLAIKGGKFVLPEDSNNTESPSGAAYELLVSFERGISVATWAGATRPEATFVPGTLGIKNTTKASPAGGVVDGLTVPVGAITNCGT